MKEKLRLLLRKPAVIALLAAELLVIGFALAAALRPAAAYTFTADQWENIAQESEIGYDKDGRIGVTEMTDGEDILQTPAMTLPKGHYNITVDYNYIPGKLESGREHHACLYLKSEEPMTVTDERTALNIDRRQDTVVLNVRQDANAVRLIAHNDGGIFTLGSVHIRQDMFYAGVCVFGWVLCFLALDMLLFMMIKVARGEDAGPKKNMACLLALAAVWADTIGYSTSPALRVSQMACGKGSSRCASTPRQKMAAVMRRRYFMAKSFSISLQFCACLVSACSRRITCMRLLCCF